MADVIKNDSAEAISQLKKLGLKVIMLTGDNERTAAEVGRQAGVDEVIAGVMPDEKAAEIKAAITAVITFITALIGPVGWLIFVWLFSMLMDYVTGSWAAIARGEWDSSVARQGLWHKLGSIVAVLIAAMLDIALGVIVPHFGINYEYIIITPIVCVWYLLTELGSMIENIDKLIEVDQSPIGRTPRSNPATYTGLFTDIRDLFAMTPDAKERGYSKSRFSFVRYALSSIKPKSLKCTDFSSSINNLNVLASGMFPGRFL